MRAKEKGVIVFQKETESLSSTFDKVHEKFEINTQEQMTDTQARSLILSHDKSHDCISTQNPKKSSSNFQ